MSTVIRPEHSVKRHQPPRIHCVIPSHSNCREAMPEVGRALARRWCEVIGTEAPPTVTCGLHEDGSGTVCIRGASPLALTSIQTLVKWAASSPCGLSSALGVDDRPDALTIVVAPGDRQPVRELTCRLAHAVKDDLLAVAWALRHPVDDVGED